MTVPDQKGQIAIDEHVRALYAADGVEETARYLQQQFGISAEHTDFISAIGKVPKLMELFFESIEFDLKYGTKTCKFISEQALIALAQNNSSLFANPESVAHGVKHRESATTVIHDALRKAQFFLREQQIETKDVSFFDLGTGTGKPVLIAAHPDFGLQFKSATGVDNVEPLVRQALANKEVMGLGSNVSFKVADATKFKDFNGVNVIFMYNPFDDTVMKAVERNLRMFAGKAIVVYNKPLHAGLFSEKNGWHQINHLTKGVKEDNTFDQDHEVRLLARGFDMHQIVNPNAKGKIPGVEAQPAINAAPELFFCATEPSPT